MERINYGFIGKEVMLDPEIPVGPKALYGVLCAYAGKEQDYCFPSISTLADVLGVTQRTVQRWIETLELKGVISREKMAGNRRGTIIRK